jgi:hypothetical protein
MAEANGDEGRDGRRVLRRCSRCRLLFEVDSATTACIVCHSPLAGLALPLTEPAVPSEVVEREPTERLKRP